MTKPGPKLGSRKPIDERIESLCVVNKTTGCWEWIGAKNNLGYGLMRDTDKMRMRTSHRMSYEFYNDTIIPVDMCVLHRCDNPCCVNPQHLWLGTRKDNTKDMENKGRHMYFGHKSLVGIPRPRKTCRYCGHIGADTQIGKYHNDKCKHKPK